MLGFFFHQAATTRAKKATPRILRKRRGKRAGLRHQCHPPLSADGRKKALSSNNWRQSKGLRGGKIWQKSTELHPGKESEIAELYSLRNKNNKPKQGKVTKRKRWERVFAASTVVPEGGDVRDKHTICARWESAEKRQPTRASGIPVAYAFCAKGRKKNLGKKEPGKGWSKRKGKPTRPSKSTFLEGKDLGTTVDLWTGIRPKVIECFS